MDSTGYIFLVTTLLILLAIGAPIAIALGAASFLYIFLFGLGNLFIFIGKGTVGILDHYVLIAVPLFVYSGKLQEAIGGPDRVLSSLIRVFGRSKTASILSLVLTAIVCPDMGADALMHRKGTTGSIVNILGAEGFDTPSSLGLAAAFTAIRVIAPPSVLLVLLGGFFEVSIGKLIITALPAAFLLSMIVVLLVPVTARAENSHNSLQSHPDTKISGVFHLLLGQIVIVGSVLVGLATPFEAGALGVAYYGCLGLIGKALKAKQLGRVTLDALQTSGAILLTIIFGMVFMMLFAVAGGMPSTGQAGSSQLHSFSGIFFISIMSIIGCTVLGPIATVIILLKLFTSVFHKSGFLLEHMVMIVVVSIAIGLIIPPFGPVFAGLARGAVEPKKKLIKGTIIYILPLFILLGLLILFPSLILFPLSIFV